jgi:hypothetical protein
MLQNIILNYLICYAKTNKYTCLGIAKLKLLLKNFDLLLSFAKCTAY